MKNVIAIGAGLADGLGFGANARTALITRGLAELTRLGVKLGYRNTEEVHVLSKKVGVEMPICEQIYAVLYHGKSPKEAALALLGRDLKNEA